jgi:carbon monoxide dehydrogenase subunit G
MASIRKEIRVRATQDAVWDVVRDVGALHDRLVPGFVVATALEPGARRVTFGNGMVVQELIVELAEGARRLVWAARGGQLSHHNASVQVFPAEGGGARVVWICDLLPDTARTAIDGMMSQAMAIMQRTLDAL